MNEGWSDYVCRCGRRLARATVSIPPTMLRLPIAVYASVFACPGCYTRLPERGLRTRWFETDDDGSVGAPIHPVSSGAPEPHEPGGDADEPRADARHQSLPARGPEEPPAPWWWTVPEPDPNRVMSGSKNSPPWWAVQTPPTESLR